MNDLFYIKKFIRDDGESLELDQNELYLDQDNTLLIRPDPDTTAVNYTEANGGEMIQQWTHTYTQEIVGLIIPKTSPYWDLVTKLTSFFKIKHTYKLIYTRKNGKLFAIDHAWISEAIQVPPQPQEDYSRWHLTLEIGRGVWREYAEDASGKEIYSNNVTLSKMSSGAGGEVWDDVGAVWDDVGAVWESGGGGIQEVYVSSDEIVYPVWVVSGESVKPRLQSNTTDETVYYDGTVSDGQTLTVDFEAGVAYLDGALVSRNIVGSFSLRPGINVVGFDNESGSASTCTLSWNNTIG